MQSQPGVLTFKIFPVKNGYGYDILSNNRMIIHQPMIPGVAGEQPFSTKKDAVKIAALVVEKIKKGQRLPAITLADLKKSGIQLKD